MSDLILHHYDRSPFSEKIRLIFGAKKLGWRSVQIPSIMPKPDVIALTGGYRKTPILQIGADIYCDTALIAKVIDNVAPTPTLYPAKYAASILATAHWVDTFFFGVAVAHVFKPENLAHMFGGASGELEAFTKDRQAMRRNATTRRLSALESLAVAQTFLREFDRQLAGDARFAGGDELSIADFSVYHCLWFMRRAPTAAKLLEPYKNVIAWMQRIADFGYGRSTELASGDAVKIAHDTKPLAIQQPQDAGDIHVGDAVEVLPTDYGIDPTPGTLATCTADEIVIRRTDARAGEVVVHFPRMYYELRKPA
ncbi:MAG TPA: glutathione S-transferase family protein [Steroidobacteraceae bacterium]|nr:glutathione S-transferase family protein [Steroidobacteraceae bacterium]